MAAILIIDPSPTIRETLRIVLGREHAVSVAASWEHVAPDAAPSLVIFGARPAPRDDAAAAAARARVAPGAPLLLLNTADEIDPRALAPPGHRVEFLPKPFDAQMLRARVRALLAPPVCRVPTEAAVARHRRWLEPPFVTAAAAAVARRAVLTRLPVLLVGEPGTGTTEVARAIHFFAGTGGRIIARSARDVGAWIVPPADGLGDTPDAVVIEDVHLLSGDAQRALLAHLAEPDAHDASARLFATTDVDLEARAADGGFARDLAYALGVVPILLTPLRDRTADLPTLVEALLPEVAARARLEAVTLTDAALARLRHYLWFGNVAELEAVLARTLALHRPHVVEPDMLVFTVPDATHTPASIPAAGTPPRPAAPSPPTPPSPVAATPASAVATALPATARARVLPLERRRGDDTAPGPAADRAPDEAADAPPPASRTQLAAASAEPGIGSAGPALEVLLGELAHELRNPMVTIKTFAQHLDSVLDDPEVRARFASLTGEAITRMDTLLETLLDFARFRAPVPRPIDLAALLARALDEHEDELARKDARLEHVGAHADATVHADEAQMLFAFRSLVDGVVRDLVAHAPVRIATAAGGAVELHVRAERAIAARLAAYVGGPEQDGESPPPLAFALAATLIRRNGGTLDVRAAADGATIITVTVPRTVAHVER